MRKQLGNENTCMICETQSNPSTIWKKTYLGNFRFCCHYNGSITGGPCSDALQASIKLNKAYVGQENYNMLLTEEGAMKIINDARKIYKISAINSGKFDDELLEHQLKNLAKKETDLPFIEAISKVKKDPYKEHRENLEKNPGYRQYLLDEHKCELCGNKGNTIDKNSHVNLFLNEKRQQFLHLRCHDIIANFAIASGISLRESFDKLRLLFEKKQLPMSDKKKECKILGSLDLIGNPWNR